MDRSGSVGYTLAPAIGMLTSEPMMLPTLAILLTFIVFSDALYVAARRFLGSRTELSDFSLFVLTRGLGPVAAAVLMYLLLLAFPRHGAGFYAAAVPAGFALPAIYGRRAFRGLIRVYRRIPAELASRAPVRRYPWLWIVVLGFVALSLALGVLIPITEHDSLVAAMEGRIMLRDLSLHSYLASSQADPATGFFYRSFRTPFLPCLYTWFGAFAGQGSQDLLARFVSPLYGIQALLLVAWAVGRRRRSMRAATWSVALLAATPIFFYMSYVNGIDPPRLYLSFLTLLWLRQILEPGAGGTLAACTGVVAGWSLFCHLIGVLPLAGGALTYLVLDRRPWLRRVALITVMTIVAFFAGAQFHYLLHPDTQKQLAKNFDSAFLDDWFALTQSFVSRGESSGEVPAPVSAAGQQVDTPAEPSNPSAALVPAAEVPGTDQQATPASQVGSALPRTATADEPPILLPAPARQDVTQARGQGSSAFSRFILGRLQLFTGVEYFGWIFCLFVGAMVAWFRSTDREPQDVLLLGAALVTALVVLSGMRKLSWSNPRYIASLALIAAYFAGPWLASLSRRLREMRPRLGPWLVRGACIVVLAPLVVATAIRGAKIEITNNGNFYSDFRSLRWVGATLKDPTESRRVFWDEYLGIRRTLEFLAAPTDEQLIHAHDFFAAVIYMKNETPPDSRALVLRDARYFYYAERSGMIWNHPEINVAFRRAPDPKALFKTLREHGITHVIVDAYSTRFEWFVNYQLDELLADDLLVENVYTFGSAEVFRLRGLDEFDQGTGDGTR